MIFAIVFDRYGCFVRQYENIAGAEHYNWSLQILFKMVPFQSKFR